MFFSAPFDLLVHKGPENVFYCLRIRLQARGKQLLLDSFVDIKGVLIGDEFSGGVRVSSR